MSSLLLLMRSTFQESYSRHNHAGIHQENIHASTRTCSSSTAMRTTQPCRQLGNVLLHDIQKELQACVSAGNIAHVATKLACKSCC